MRFDPVHTVFVQSQRLKMSVVLGLTLLSLPLLSQAGTPGVVYSLDAEAARPELISNAGRVSKQARGNANPLVLNGLKVEAAMTGVGEVTALALSENGTLYAADRARGRVWLLSDRGQDGKLDGKLPVCGDFDAPSGLAAFGENIVFIADRQAIYRCDIKTSKKVEHVNLRRADGDPSAARPLALSPKTGVLYLGLNAEQGRTPAARLIEIDLTTKSARQSGTYTAPIGAISALESGSVWISVGGSLMTADGSNSVILEGGKDPAIAPYLEINGLALPGQFGAPNHWPEGLKDHILITQSGPYALPKGSSGGFNLVAIPTEFGRPKAELTPLVDGFLNRRGTSAWGKPGAMVMDARGLYVADPWQGTLWRLSAVPPVVTQTEKRAKRVLDQKNDTETATDTTAATGQKPVGLVGAPMVGSTVTGSSITQGSQIAVGSYLVEEYERKKKEAAEAEKAKKEERRKAADDQ